MRTVLGVALLGVLAAGCGRSEPNVVKREGEPDVVIVGDQDREMNLAMLKARETLGEFVARLEHPPASQTAISLKARFAEGDVVEHMWLRDVVQSGEAFEGLIGNTPADLVKVKLGDRVTVPRDQVSDWMAIDGGRLVGGFTIRVLYNREPPEERKDFEEGFGAKIE